MATQNDLLLKAYEKLGGSAEDLVTTPELQFMPTTTALIYLIALKIAGSGIVVTLDAGTDTYNVDAGSIIEYILIYDTVNLVFSCGSALAGTDIADNIQLPPGGQILDFKKFYLNAGTLYFSGTTDNTVIAISIKKIDTNKIQ